MNYRTLNVIIVVVLSGGSGTGSGAGTGSAGPGGVSASGVSYTTTHLSDLFYTSRMIR